MSDPGSRSEEQRDPQPASDAFRDEPLAGEGTDDDEATVTRGPAVGGSTGKAGEGTAADAEASDQ